jgi:hypothetical protein
MRKQFVLSAAAVGIAAAFMAAPAANAKPVIADFIGLHPSSGARPGESVDVFGVCNEPGFTSRQLESPVLEPAKVTRNLDGEAPSVSGHTQVKKDAKPGRYSVSLKCSGVPVKTAIVVIGSNKQPTSTPSGQVKVKPRGAAETGGGEN